MQKRNFLGGLVLLLVTVRIIMKVKRVGIMEETIMRKGRYSADTIAKWFLYYNDADVASSGADMISNLKLQKLLYYAQGCYLAITENKLFEEDILAWDHGPVVEEVYQEYKGNKANGIAYEGDYDQSIDRDTENILESVYDIFGKYSAWGLRNMTHQETPWLETPRSHVIPLDKIKEYFKEHYVE